jgi:hypothetical protein
MRPVLFVALLGTTFSTYPAVAQSSAEQPAPGAQSKASASGKKQHTSTAMDGLFENGPERPNALAEARREAAERQQPAEKSTAATQLPPAPPAPALPTVQAVPPGPPQKNLTGAEFGLVRVGATQKEVLAVLGPPSSRVVVPDDDGHLRETLQYWVKGSPMGTVRLDNGRVVQIETRPK